MDIDKRSRCQFAGLAQQREGGDGTHAGFSSNVTRDGFAGLVNHHRGTGMMAIFNVRVDRFLLPAAKAFTTMRRLRVPARTENCHNGASAQQAGAMPKLAAAMAANITVSVEAWVRKQADKLLTALRHIRAGPSSVAACEHHRTLGWLRQVILGPVGRIRSLRHDETLGDDSK